MSQPRQQIKRTTVNQSQLPKGNQTLSTRLISGIGSNHTITNNLGTGYQNYTTITSSHVINSQGELVNDQYGPGFSQGTGELEWQEYQDKLVVNGDTDFVALKNMKNAMLELINEFKSRDNLVFKGEYRQNFEKRLILLEHEFEGLMRRVLNLKYMHPTDSKRSIDYSKFITEKENLIIELEKKIANLEQRNRPEQEKLISLEAENTALKSQIINKNSYIQDLSRQLEKGLGFNNSNARYDAIQGYLASLESQLDALKTKNPTLPNLEATIEGWISGLPHGSQLQRKLEAGTLRTKEDELYVAMLDKLRYAQDLFAVEIAEIQRVNPNFNLPAKSKILEILSASNTRVGGVKASGIVEIQKEVRIERQIGVQDARTKALITSLARYVKNLLVKYPKLRQDLDVQIQQYISDEMIDVICDDDLDKIISITKYVPQVVKVENVYTYSSEKTRKVQFYLRVLIKALLEQLEKLKGQHGLALQIDQGILGMIRAEILDLVDIDAILKLFRSAPKVVQVPKYVQKVVDNIVTIPQRYQVKEYTTKVIPIAKTEVVHDREGVMLKMDNPFPLEKQIPVKFTEHIERPVKYTQHHQVPVNQVIERTHAMEVPTKEQIIVEKDRPVEIPGADNIVIEKQLQVVQVPKTDVRYIETVQEVVKPVEYVVQKLVERLVERERAVAVPVLREKLVKETVYEVIKENNPVLVTKYEIAQETHEKIVQFIQTKDKIVPVPQVVEKLVPVEKTVQLPPKEVKVREQVMVTEKVPEYIEVPKTEVVIKNQQVPVEVEKYIDKPLFVEIVKVEKEISEVPMIHQFVREVHIPVEISKPYVINREVPVEVPTTYPHYVNEQVPVYFKEEQSVPFPVYYDRVRTEVQIVQKIIEKIVQVPKCVEVQKIVQKIVIVPRIIEKIVEVPQIIEKIVQKFIEVPKQMPPIERIVQKPCFVEKIVEVPVERIVYITVESQKRVIEQVLRKDTEVRTIEVPVEITKERIVTQKSQVPVNCYRDRVEYMYIDDVKVVKTDNVIIHPVEIPVPIILEKDLPITITHERVHILPVPQLVEKIVPQIEQRVRVEKVDVVHNIPYIQDQVKIVEKDRVVIEKKYEPVDLIQEKIVQVVTLVEQIKEVPLIFEQLVPVVKEIPKIYEFDRDPKIVQVPQRVEIIEKIKPYIVNVNKYIERIVQKLVEVPYMLKETNLQTLKQENMIAGDKTHTKDTQVVQMNVERELYIEVEKKVLETVHRIDQVMKCATEIIERDREPVMITKDRILQVPFVLEKIVQKIVVMPQVVEVLKYVHELIENDQLNILTDGDVELVQYKEIAVGLEREMGGFLDQLRRIKTQQPALAGRIDLIERYFSDFKRYIKHPKLFEKIKEVRSEPVKEIVRVPHERTAEQAKQDLAKVLLIEQLLAGLRKIGAQNKNVNLNNYLQPEIMAMFDVNFSGSVKRVNDSFKSQLGKFQQSIESKFSKLNGWGTDHNIMLKSFIDERFQLANVIKRTKEINAQLTKENNDLREKLERERDIHVKIIELLIEFNQFMPRILSVLDKDKHRELYDSYTKLVGKFQNFKKLYDSIIGDSHFGRTFQLDAQFIEKYRGSSIREFVRQIEILREKLRTSSWREHEHSACDATIQRLKEEISRLESMHRERRLVYTQSEAEVQSPKRTVNTHISPAERKAYESQYIPGSQSDVEAYGQNFGEYVISDPNDAGLISGRRDFQTYGSSVEQQQQRRDLASSAATYRSNQVITSSQAIRVEGGGTSGNTIGISGNTIGISGGNGVGGSYSGGSTGYVSTTGGYTSTTGGIKTIGGGISGGNGGNVVIETTRRVYEEGGSSGSSGSPTIGLRSGYGQGAVNLSGDNNQLMVGGSGSGNSSYGGGGVKITTSRITSGGDNSGSMRQVQQTEATYSSTTREGVPTTTRKYQFHERKYEKE